MRANLFLFIIGLAFASCASPRKLSQVGLREPANVREVVAVSPLRQRAAGAERIDAGCPADLRATFSGLAAERLQFPGCPENVKVHFQNALLSLKLEERSTLEEVLGSQCRSLGLSEFGDSLEQLVASYDTTGPLGRRSSGEEEAPAADLQALRELKGSLETLTQMNLPLERWARRYGSFVLPEEDLQFLTTLVIDHRCRLGEDQVDESYRTIRSLENLAEILRRGPQYARIQRFLVGVHQITDKRLPGFFGS